MKTINFPCWIGDTVTCKSRRYGLIDYEIVKIKIVNEKDIKFI